MAVGGRLPALVTPLEGDISDLASAFQEGTALAELYVAEIDTILTVGMRDAGKHSADAWGNEINEGMEINHDSIRGHMHELADDLEDDGRLIGQRFTHGFEDELLGSRGSGGGSERGRRAGIEYGNGFLSGLSSLGSMFSSVLIPLIVVAVIAALPIIGALIASAVVVALGVGFAALGTVIAVAMLPKIQKGFARLANPLREMFRYAITGAFDNALAGVPKIIAKWLPVFRVQLRGLFDSLAPILRPLTEAVMKAIANILDGATEAINTSMPALLTFIETIPEVADSFGKMLAKIAEDPEALSRFIKDAAHFTSELVIGLGNTIHDLTEIYNWVVKLNDKHPFINVHITKPEKDIAAFLPKYWTAFKAGWSIRWNEFQNWAKTKWGEFTTWVSAIPGRVGNFVSKIPGFLKKMLHQILFDIGYAMGKILIFFMELPGNVVKLLKSFSSSVWKELTATVHMLYMLGRAAVMALINWFKTLPARGKEQGENFKKKILDFFKSAPGWLYNAGKNMIIGLANGIKDTLTWAVNKAKAAAHDIADGFKKALGIKSPSTVAYGIGRFFMQGLGNGLTGSMGFLRSGWNRVVDAMSAGGYATVSAGMRVLGATGGGGSDSGYDRAAVLLDGQAVGYALIPSAQRRASRNAGQTGLGGRTVLGFGGA